MRKRPVPGIVTAKLHSSSRANSSRWRSVIIAWASPRVTSAVSFCAVMGFMPPSTFMLGGKSLAMNRSEPPAADIAASSLCM